MNKYDKKHIANVRDYQRRIDNIYKKAVEQITMRSAGLDAPDGYIFTFDDFPALRKQIDALISKMQSDIEFTVTDGVRAEWDLANAKNDALVGTLPDALSGLAKYHRTHEDALSAFLGRKHGGLGLSENVWKYATQFKDEIEMGLDCGIRDGLDAASMARQLKQYLQFPDMLFRRVRDEHGVLHLSQRAAAFHPGQGVYRSSYKNARRLAATETNMAYRTSDHERWKDLDFIVGIEIHLSNNHTCLNNKGKPVPFSDICDELQGKYPKEFKFVGWHPHCRCIATPIMKTKAELDADDERLKRGEEPSDPSTSENAVTDMPDGWKQWMEDNAERLENAKSMPYFIRDNFVDGDPSAGLRWIEEKPQNVQENVDVPQTLRGLDKAIEDFAKGSGYGVYERQHAAEIEAKMREIFALHDYGMNVDDKILLKIEKTGTFKNTFETGTSKGWVGSTQTQGKIEETHARLSASHKLFGIGDDLANGQLARHQYEKYGSLLDRDIAESMNDHYAAKTYGNVEVRFKKDKVTCTWTAGDSLNCVYQPSLTTDPKAVSFDDMYDRAGGWRKPPISTTEIDKMSKILANNVRGYLELQYHGELTLDCVESVAFPYDLTQKTKYLPLAKRLKARGIKVFYKDINDAIVQL